MLAAASISLCDPLTWLPYVSKLPAVAYSEWIKMCKFLFLTASDDSEK